MFPKFLDALPATRDKNILKFVNHLIIFQKNHVSKYTVTEKRLFHEDGKINPRTTKLLNIVLFKGEGGSFEPPHL